MYNEWPVGWLRVLLFLRIFSRLEESVECRSNIHDQWSAGTHPRFKPCRLIVLVVRRRPLRVIANDWRRFRNALMSIDVVVAPVTSMQGLLL